MATRDITAYAAQPMRGAIKAYLAADSALTALLTGGLFTADDLPATGMTLENAPKAANGVTILPHAVLHYGAAPRAGFEDIGAQVQDLEIYIYDQRGYNTIDQAHSLLFALLDDINMQVSDRSLVHLRFLQVGPETMAENLNNAACQFGRYAITQIRGE